jgi:uncharacterized membrane protein YgdD (TMEM256/DUF423 family)
MRTLFALGSLNAFLAVGLGALGAHAFRPYLEGDQETYNTAVQYQFWNSLGVLLVVLLSDRLGSSRLMQAAGWLMYVGSILFAGSLYYLSLGESAALLKLTPVGGASFLIGWLLLFIAALQRPRNPSVHGISD